ncbi:uncharacterized protein LOC144870931 [Branchiostoma floridae x Branchiostoma japonicum]
MSVQPASPRQQAPSTRQPPGPYVTYQSGRQHTAYPPTPGTQAGGASSGSGFSNSSPRQPPPYPQQQPGPYTVYQPGGQQPAYPPPTGPHDGKGSSGSGSSTVAVPVGPGMTSGPVVQEQRQSKCTGARCAIAVVVGLCVAVACSIPAIIRLVKSANALANLP